MNWPGTIFEKPALGRWAAVVLAVAALALALAAIRTPAAAEDLTRIQDSEAWDIERAFVELERLRMEIRTLSGLAGAQAELLAWNRKRAESGAGPAVLPASLCAALGTWCRVLPATFGADAAGAAGKTAPGDGADTRGE